MSGFDRILVPLDGSPRAEAALRWVHLLPAREIHLMRVCGDQQSERDRAERYLNDVGDRLRLTGSAVRTSVADGEPADAIVDAASACDLIVMSTQGAGGGGRFMYGSVADRVARHAPVPTLLARGGAIPVELTPLRRIVVPLDGSPTAERALPLASVLARVLHAGLHLIAVDETSPEESRSRSEDHDVAGDAADDALSAYLSERVAALREPDIAVSAEHCRGEPATELLARVVPGDLLVLTAHGRGTARRWQVGTVAERLLRQAAAPVVLLRADGV